MDNDRDIKFDNSDRSPLEEQFCVFKIIKMSAIFKMAAKTWHKKWVVKIQHCLISSKFDMVDNDVPTGTKHVVVCFSVGEMLSLENC